MGLDSIGGHYGVIEAGLWKLRTGWPLPAYLVHHPQSVLNAAARLIYHMRSADYVTVALVSLHWLCVPEQILYNIAVLTYNVPLYLGPFARVADQPAR